MSCQSLFMISFVASIIISKSVKRWQDLSKRALFALLAKPNWEFGLILSILLFSGAWSASILYEDLFFVLERFMGKKKTNSLGWSFSVRFVVNLLSPQMPVKNMFWTRWRTATKWIFLCRSWSPCICSSLSPTSCSLCSSRNCKKMKVTFTFASPLPSNLILLPFFPGFPVICRPARLTQWALSSLLPGRTSVEDSLTLLLQCFLLDSYSRSFLLFSHCCEDDTRSRSLPSLQGRGGGLDLWACLWKWHRIWVVSLVFKWRGGAGRGWRRIRRKLNDALEVVSWAVGTVQTLAWDEDPLSAFSHRCWVSPLCTKLLGRRERQRIIVPVAADAIGWLIISTLPVTSPHRPRALFEHLSLRPREIESLKVWRMSDCLTILKIERDRDSEKERQRERQRTTTLLQDYKGDHSLDSSSQALSEQNSSLKKGDELSVGREIRLLNVQ